MSGNSPLITTEIKLRSRTRVLEVAFTDGRRFELPFEYLRVYSPSAEVRGHGDGEGVHVVGKRDVADPGDGIRNLVPRKKERPGDFTRPNIHKTPTRLRLSGHNRGGILGEILQNCQHF